MLEPQSAIACLLLAATSICIDHRVGLFLSLELNLEASPATTSQIGPKLESKCRAKPEQPKEPEESRPKPQ